MLKEKVLLTVASGMLGTTLAVAPIVVNSTSLTQADVDQMSGIEKTVTKNAREFLNSLNGTEEQLVFEDETLVSICLMRIRLTDLQRIPERIRKT